jgi:hypothetical protein
VAQSNNFVGLEKGPRHPKEEETVCQQSLRRGTLPGFNIRAGKQETVTTDSAQGNNLKMVSQFLTCAIAASGFASFQLAILFIDCTRLNYLGKG